jgi:hypothetical protein
MLIRYLAQVVLTSLVAVPCAPAQHNLYSPRALHRVRTELALALWQARVARLDAARAAIAGRLPIDALLALPDDAAILAKGPHDAHLKQLAQPGATNCR